LENGDGRAIDVPWSEVRIELPANVLGDLQREAIEHGVSVETLILAIVVRSQTGHESSGANK
jgi:hypothetical protein